MTSAVSRPPAICCRWRYKSLVAAVALAIVLTGCTAKPAEVPYGQTTRPYLYVTLVPRPQTLSDALGVNVTFNGSFGTLATLPCEALQQQTLETAARYSDPLLEGLSDDYNPNYRAAMIHYFASDEPTGSEFLDIGVFQSPGTSASGQPFDFMGAVNTYPCPDMITRGQQTGTQWITDHPNFTVTVQGSCGLGKVSCDYDDIPDVAVPLNDLPTGAVGYAYPSLDWYDPAVFNDTPLAQAHVPGKSVIYAEQDGYFIAIGFEYRAGESPVATLTTVLNLVEDSVAANHASVEQMSGPPSCADVLAYLGVSRQNNECPSFL